MSRARFAVVVATGVLGLAACGSSKAAGSGGEAGSGSGTTAAAGAATTAKGSSSGSGSGSIANEMVAAFNAVAKGDCGKAKSIGDSIDGGDDPAAALSQFGDLGKALDKLASSGPSELRGDFATLSKAFGSMAKALEELGVDDPSKLASVLNDPAKAAKFEELGKQLDSAEVNAAGENIDKWVESKCPGLDND